MRHASLIVSVFAVMLFSHRPGPHRANRCRTPLLWLTVRASSDPGK